LLDDDDLPCILFSHEFMGMPTALQAILDGEDAFRTVFHAHECATARRIVEDHPGHDTMFYNVLQQARDKGLYVQDVFGPRDDAIRHALVSRAHLCDAVLAVGDHTRDEMLFLNEHFDNQPVDLVYNGIPSIYIDLDTRLQARQMLADYAKTVLGHEPDVLMTHVTRPVISKGLWRDLTVCHELDARFTAKNQTGILFILATAGGVRRTQDVNAMAQHYGWPYHHREGYPDLVGPEVDINQDIEHFNANHQAIKAVLINQFGFSRRRLGEHAPIDMNMGNLRCATDIEFGMATYEPFGISPLEPLGAGALCVISSVCGCQDFVHAVTNNNGSDNVIIADFTQLDHPQSIDQLLDMTREQRDAIEHHIAAQVADTIMQRLPRSSSDRQALIDAGRELVQKMNWDQVVEKRLLPVLHRITTQP
jgi:hypothetical protein